MGAFTLCHVAHCLCHTIWIHFCHDWSRGMLIRPLRAADKANLDAIIQISINILAQIIPGTLLPGKPLANMIFKSYSIQTLVEAITFVQDLKLGHYVKVPPRAIFVGKRGNI